MLSSSSSQCKHVWSKSPESNPRNSLWKRSLIDGYLKGGDLGIAVLNEYHVRNLKAKILMYFFVVWLGKKGCFLKRLFGWEFLFLPDNSFCSPAVVGDFFMLTCNRDQIQTKATALVMMRLIQCELLLKESSEIWQWSYPFSSSFVEYKLLKWIFFHAKLLSLLLSFSTCF